MNKNINNTLHVINGREVWESRSCAVVAIVLAKKNKEIYVLIEQRSVSMPQAPMKWCLPGGYLDWNEDGISACIREVFEETKLNLNKYSNNIIFKASNPFYTRTNPEGKEDVVLFYGIILDLDLNDIELPKIKANPSECLRSYWVNVKDIQKLNYSWAFDHDIRLHEALVYYEDYLQI